MDRTQQFNLGRMTLGVGFLGLGALTLVYRDFALQWQPIPAEIPGFMAAVYISAFALIAGALALQIPRIARPAAVSLCAYFVLFWVAPHLVRLAPRLTNLVEWLGTCEALGALSGLLALIALLSARRDGALTWLVLPQRLFGLCCLIYGLSHFAYAHFTAEMIPAWFPQRLALAYLTGSAHILAGIAILIGVRAVLAATLEALMMSLFVLLLHVPSLWANPPPPWATTWRTIITPFFWATSLAGAAWLVAASLKLCAARAAPTRP